MSVNRAMFTKENKMKPVLGALTIALLGSSLSGCGYIFGDAGYFRDRGSDYQTAAVEPRMTVPPELEHKPLGDMLPVPGVTSPALDEKFTTPRPQPLDAGADGSAFSLQQDGASRWLLAQRAPEEVWPRVRQFLTAYDIPVAHEDASLGEMETAWIAFDLQPDNPLVRRLAPAVGPSRTLDGREQRFRVRIEPGVRATNTEIHVLHMSRSQGGTLESWPESSENVNLERAFLAELETHLSQSSGDDVASLMATRDVPTSANSSLGQDGAGNPVLTLQSEFNRAWASVGAALGRADILVADLNRSAGVYYVDLNQTRTEQESKGFFSGLFGGDEPVEEDSFQRIQVRLTQIGNQVLVTVEESIENAAEAALARDLLKRIRDNLS
ncbi:MAG TPA: outer membrane protein assembly factor BamC [Pseudomonas xinjiangensis]|uniref:Outer membrane protein assembly factor BamC n=2 Tax=root TaxID=1 RepID=A0A7V1BN34_9GAMM|nr:outer membrane protein assembly factor BamC [Halopseudomonas xinjiangensis]HEC48020.1 outer membrane protein assembly factor BamC [Halopseudomonas xinjiangensis]